MFPEIIRQKLRDLPDQPGCYIMRDRRGRIIYVGKAASLRQRVRSYFRRAARRRADPRLSGLIGSIADFDVLPLKTEADALLTESKLIKDYRPWFNVKLRDDKRFLLLRADPVGSFPRFRLCRLARHDGALYFGPYVSSAAARAALEFVEKRYGLRKCAATAPGPEEHRHCINDIVRFCSAPCIGKTDGAGYQRNFEEACAFLRGARPAVFKEVEAAMAEAARELRFEKAAALRDTLRLLRAAVRQRAHIARAPGLTQAEGLAGVRALQEALGLQEIPHRIEACDLSNISGTLAVGSLVVAIDGIARPEHYRRFRIRTAATRDDPAMMAELVRRRFGSDNNVQPDLLLVDGGITQLRAALAELARAGCAKIPVAGLAKRLETIFYGQRRLLLEKNSPALHVLQRLRDEAHRFALAYHRELRAKRLRESGLDEIPGIGARRKQILLRHFGSLSRVKQAAEETIAAVPGIGPLLARTIKHS